MPEAITEIIHKADECSLKVEWTAPSDGGFALKGYKVDVMGSDDRFYTIKNCDKDRKSTATIDPLSTICFISMKDLYAKPYLLRANDEIKLRI